MTQLDILVESVWETLSLPEIATADLNGYADRESLNDSLTQAAGDAIEVLPLATIFSVVADEPWLYERPVEGHDHLKTFITHLLIDAVHYRLWVKAILYNADFTREQFDAEQKMLDD